MALDSCLADYLAAHLVWKRVVNSVDYWVLKKVVCLVAYSVLKTVAYLVLKSVVCLAVHLADLLELMDYYQKSHRFHQQ